jgi:hypothetical protein
MDKTGRGFMRDPDVRFQLRNQFLQGQRNQPAENVAMTGFQRFTSLFLSEAGSKTLVMVHTTVVIPSRRKIDEAREVAGNARQRAALQVVISVADAHEICRSAHGTFKG